MGLREIRRDILFSKRVARAIRDSEKMKLLYAYVLKSDSNCVDIGAHVGDFLSVFEKLAPFGKHIAVEPLPNLVERLEKQFPNIKIHQTALSDKSGFADFIHVKNYEAWSGLRERSYPGNPQKESIKVPLTTLDELLPLNYKPDLIKVDVEGAELEVFRGSINTLQKYHPYLVFEHDTGGYNSYDTKPSEIWKLLVLDLGYRIFELEGEGPLSEERFSDLTESGKRWNFIAHL